MDRDTAVAMIEERFAQLETQNFYEFIGVTQQATIGEIKAAYRGLVVQFHADKFRNLELGDAEKKLQQVFARLTDANTTLTDADKRAAYDDKLAGGGEDDASISASEMEDIFAAEEAFRRGRSMLDRGEIKGAVAKFELAARVNPDDPDTLAYYAYARFLVAPVGAKGERSKEAGKAKSELEKLAKEHDKRVVPLYCYARVLKLSGLNDDALRTFKKVLSIDKRHTQAESEIRLMSSRKDENKAGFVGKLKSFFGRKG